MSPAFFFTLVLAAVAFVEEWEDESSRGGEMKKRWQGLHPCCARLAR